LLINATASLLFIFYKIEFIIYKIKMYTAEETIEYSCLECEILYSLSDSITETNIELIKYKKHSEYKQICNNFKNKTYTYSNECHYNHYSIYYCHSCFSDIMKNGKNIYSKEVSLDKFLDKFLLKNKDPKNIRKIKITFPTNIQFIDITSEKYPNLEVLNIQNIHCLTECYLGNFNKLVNLKINYITQTYKHYYTFPQQLQKLSIGTLNGFSLKCNLHKLNQLYKLSLNGSLNRESLLLKFHPNLKKLKLTNFTIYITDEEEKIEIDITNLDKLESLSIQNTKISNLPKNLKYLITNTESLLIHKDLKTILSFVENGLDIKIVEDYNFRPKKLTNHCDLINLRDKNSRLFITIMTKVLLNKNKEIAYLKSQLDEKYI